MGQARQQRGGRRAHDVSRRRAFTSVESLPKASVGFAFLESINKVT